MDDVYKIAFLNCLQYFMHCEYCMNYYTALFREIKKILCTCLAHTTVTFKLQYTTETEEE